MGPEERLRRLADPARWNEKELRPRAASRVAQERQRLWLVRGTIALGVVALVAVLGIAGPPYWATLTPLGGAPAGTVSPAPVPTPTSSLSLPPSWTGTVPADLGSGECPASPVKPAGMGWWPPSPGTGLVEIVPEIALLCPYVFHSYPQGYALGQGPILLTDQKQARELAGWLDTVPLDFDPHIRYCPLDTGSVIDVFFQSATGQQALVVIQLEGCGSVSNGTVTGLPDHGTVAVAGTITGLFTARAKGLDLAPILAGLAPEE